MGGDAGMHSEPGNGSTFWLTARLKRTDEPLAPADIPDDDDGDPLAQIQQHFAACTCWWSIRTRSTGISPASP